VFSQVLLADEINRASPKTQSALLEAMEERQVSVEGHAQRLPDPFFVIATQNPQDQVGTFALPESQLDRFLMCIELGYPDPKSERALLEGEDRRPMLQAIKPRMNPAELLEAQSLVKRIKAAPALLDYVQNLLTQSRRSAQLAEGLSPRAGLALLQAARAWAMLDGRNHVLPDDVQAVLPAVGGHRLKPSKGGAASYRARSELVAELVQSVALP
jgi:MoxR-like ATPase